jgi:hypothetical protein
MDVEISNQHDELINSLYDLRQRMNRISRDERLILEMAIQILEYLDEYAVALPAMGHDYSREELEANEPQVEAARRVSKIRWTGDDFERLICSGGFELYDGNLRPRF